MLTALVSDRRRRAHTCEHAAEERTQFLPLVHFRNSERAVHCIHGISPDFLSSLCRLSTQHSDACLGDASILGLLKF
jgi:hypothetical protein